jgi:magnesium-transporting ATPase (P-type)
MIRQKINLKLQDVHTTHESQLFSRNMAFYSTHVVRGTAKAVVTRTGINTVFGQMADLTASNPKDETLITKELSQFLHLVFAIFILFILGRML